MSVDTPASLLERLRSPDDPAAWDRFVALYVPLLRRWAIRLGVSGPDVDDLVQEVLTTLVRTMPGFRYDAGGRFRGWLWTVTANKWRELNRRRIPVGLGGLDAAGVTVPDPVEATDAAEYRRYLVGRATRLMRAEFPPAAWRAFLETTVDGRPASDVAARLGTTVGAVYAAKSRVLRRLRRELDGLADWD